MANEARGEIAAEFEGKPFKLVLTANAICSLEHEEKRRAYTQAREFGLPLDQVRPRKINRILTDLSNPDELEFSDVRMMFWAMMLEQKPDATLEDAGRLIAGLSGEFDRIMNDAILAAFPDAPDGDQEGGEPGN